MTDPERDAKRQNKPSTAPTRTQKQRRQQRYRRSNTLIQKAYKLSTMADVYMFLGIRDRTTERIKTLCADDKTRFGLRNREFGMYLLSIRVYINWFLVETYYPIPEQKTTKDFSSRKKSKIATSTTTKDAPEPENSTSELGSKSSIEPSDISNMDWIPLW